MELLRLCARRVLHDQPLKLIYRVKKIDSSAPIHIVWFEQPDVPTVEQSLPHEDRGVLSLLLTEVVVGLNVLVHGAEHFLFGFGVSTLFELLLELLDHVEVVAELVELVLAKRRPQINDKCDRYRVEHVYVEILTEFGHAVKEQVLRCD